MGDALGHCFVSNCATGVRGHAEREVVNMAPVAVHLGKPGVGIFSRSGGDSNIQGY
jgi:glutamate/tyrosine decarboxylase-like PLP-dependent enzyme